MVVYDAPNSNRLGIRYPYSIQR